MVLAVTIFDRGAYKFKTEVFAVLANIAWTYLLHESTTPQHFAKKLRRHNTRAQLYAVTDRLPIVKGHEEKPACR